MEGMSKLLRFCVLPATALALLVIGLVPSLASAAEPLSPFLTVSGEHLALSVDGLGTNEPTGGPIMVEKKDAGETVREAYLFAASTGETDFVPNNDEVTLNGTGIEWEAAHTISSDINSFNVVANVTSIVKPIVDSASPGLVPLTVAEGENTADYDGEILAVVLEDPAVQESRSLTLLYGAQNPLGDTFHVGLAEPVNKTNPSFQLNLSLGISYGYQPAGQYSIIEVNKKLMTSSAGGQDDCIEKYSPTPDWAACGNGELITVGGIGDSLEDPPNPAATDFECENEKGERAPRCDDELYSLLPFVSEGETNLTFNTDNPSDNDNIFFGALEVHGGAAVVGEGITLSPTTATNKIGETHTVTATVQNTLGEPIQGTEVHFEVTAGPNKGTTGTGTTNSAGKATFTYTSSKTGTDEIVATFKNKEDETESSNEASETWEEATTEEPQKTSLTSTLSGGGKSGGNITVTEGTSVSDEATLKGVNASTATGSVSYDVYSNASCSDLVMSAGSAGVVDGSVGQSGAETLPAGTYYWQASYSGDGRDLPSTSRCGSEILTVKARKESGEGCTSVVGVVRVKVNGERTNAVDDLNTTLKKPQRFGFHWANGHEHVKLTQLTSASCVVRPTNKTFTGVGDANLNGKPGYTVKLSITVTTKGTDRVIMRLYRGMEEVASEALSARATEEIS
jgi:Bacterial Ig-like domain (group 1)